jgi:hypothetical protein
VSGLRLTADAYTLADRMAHYEETVNANSVAGQSAASSMTARGVAAVMAGAGLHLADFGVTQSSVVDALVAAGGNPAAVKAAIFHIFFRATSIASKLAADGMPTEAFSIDVEAIIEVLTMFGDGDADGIGALDPGIAALVTSLQAGTAETRALKDAVFSFVVMTPAAAGAAAAAAGVDLGGYNISNATYAGVLRAVAADAGYADDALAIFAGCLYTDRTVRSMLSAAAESLMTGEAEVDISAVAAVLRSTGALDAADFKSAARQALTSEVGCCKLKRIKTRVESAGSQRLKLKSDEQLSNFAFNSNLRPYSEAVVSGALAAAGVDVSARSGGTGLTLADFQTLVEAAATSDDAVARMVAASQVRLWLPHTG